jgi:hypothetical protein
MLESISQELPEDVRASLVSICGLEILYAPIRHALRKLRSHPAIEKKKADAEHAMNGAQSQAKSHKDALASLQASYDLKIARKAALEAELRSLSATCLVLKVIARNCWTPSAKQHPMLVV